MQTQKQIYPLSFLFCIGTDWGEVSEEHSMQENAVNMGWRTEVKSCPGCVCVTPTTSQAISLKATMPFSDVSHCSVWALEGVGRDCTYRRELAGPNLPLRRHVLVSEDTEANLVKIKRKSYLQPVLIRPNYLYATIVSKVNPENKIKYYIVFINGYSKIKPWHLKGWPEILIILLQWFGLKLTHLLIVLLFHFCNPTIDMDYVGFSCLFNQPNNPLETDQFLGANSSPTIYCRQILLPSGSSD